MDNPRAEKLAVVDEVREHFQAADAAFLTEYRGLKVKDLATLRRNLRASGGEYRIYKNTLVRFAARDAGLVDLEALLVGPTAVTFVQGDAAAVAKALRDYSRTNPLLVLKGGVLGDKVIGATETAALAELPSREVLLSRFAGGLAAPMQQLASLLQALPRNLAYGLKALIDQRVEGGESAVVDEPAVADEPTAAAAAEPLAAEPAEEPEVAVSAEPTAGAEEAAAEPEVVASAPEPAEDVSDSTPSAE